MLVFDAWDGLKNLQPDVLMVPIGGGMTMDIADALMIVEWMSPKMVIPCHYNCDFLFKKNGLPADSAMFKREVEKMGFLCTIMHYGDEIEV